MPEKRTEFDAAEYIETVEDARQHLELCAEQDPGDGSAIRAALNTIARAQNMSGLARRRRAQPGRALQGAVPRTATQPSRRC